MVNAFVFYVEEMAATLILSTILFVVIGGAVLILFFLDQAYSVVFNWSEVMLRRFVHLASRVYEIYHPTDYQLAAVRRSVFVLTARFSSYVSARVDRGLQLGTTLMKKTAPLSGKRGRENHGLLTTAAKSR